jgi:hypothetical protein
VNPQFKREFHEDFAGKVAEAVRENSIEGRFIQAVGILGDWGSGSMLSLAMMDWIIQDDVVAARTHLMQATGFIPRLGEPVPSEYLRMEGRTLIEGAIEEFRTLQGIHRRNATMDMRDGPFCLIAAAVLTNTLQEHLPLLRGLAPLICEHNDDNYASLDALGLLAFITGDDSLRQAFHYRVERYLKAKFLLSFFRGTMVQIQALLARDQAAIDAATNQAASEFLLRAKDKKTLGQRQGLGMYSQVEFDLRGTTVGKLARMNGLRFEHDSRAIPLGVIRMFE